MKCTQQAERISLFDAELVFVSGGGNPGADTTSLGNIASQQTDAVSVCAEGELLSLGKPPIDC